MRILVISDKIPSARLGDGLRLFGLLKPLSSRHQFDLLCFKRPHDTIEPDATAVFGNIWTLPFPSPSAGRTGSRALRAFRLTNFKAHSSEMREAIGKALARAPYDAMLDIAANMLLALPESPLDVPLIVDSIDEPVLRDLRALRHVSPAGWPRLIRQVLMYWRYEQATMRRAAVNIYASEVDARFYAAMFPRRRVAVIPNGVDIDFFSPDDSRRPDPDLLVFEGNMMFPPNVDAARRLCRDILPLLRAKRARARVCLVGREPPPEVQALRSDVVQVTGTVPDVRPYLSAASVFACPMRLGSGIKNKILQAWAMGIPVVATPESLGGLAAEDGRNILVRDSPSAFADAIADLLDNPERASALGRAGRRTVEELFSWERCAGAFENILAGVMTPEEGADG